jgi:phospholipase/lecithinase/hemolysin
VCAALLAASFTPMATAQGPSVNAIYSFGDSLSDTGNIFAATTALGIEPAVPPSVSPHRTYYNGRFSNGPVAVEYLWQLISGNAPDRRGALEPILVSGPGPLGRAVDFAFGGTGTPFLDRTPGEGLWAPGLKGQVALFRAALRGREPSKRALYVIVTGANDYRDDETNEPMHPQEVVQNILDAVADLYELGARQVMVADLPDPVFLPGGDPTGQGSAIAALHNFLLGQGLDGLEAQHSDLRIIRIRLNELFPLLPGLGFEVTTPALALLVPPPFPFGVPTYQCLWVLAAACQDVNFDVAGQLGLPVLFWDIVHPTTDAHRVLGEYMYDQLN